MPNYTGTILEGLEDYYCEWKDQVCVYHSCDEECEKCTYHPLNYNNPKPE